MTTRSPRAVAAVRVPGPTSGGRVALRVRAVLSVVAVVAGAAAAGGCGGGASAEPAAEGGTLIFRGDYSTGDLSQWDGVQRVRASSAAVVTADGGGPAAARFEVREDDAPVAGGERAEVQRITGEKEGLRRIYTWSTMLAEGLPVTPEWQVVMQWHADGREGPPSVAFYVEDGMIELQVRAFDEAGEPIGEPRIVWSEPQRTGEWYDFRMEVVWSASDEVGLVRLEEGGQEVALLRTRTLYPGHGAYLKQGYYRSDAIDQAGAVFHRGLTVVEIPRDDA